MGELRHKDVTAGRVRENEYEHVRQHILNGQAKGDIVYAESDTQLSGKPIGSTNQVLTVVGGTIAWSDTPTFTTLTLTGKLTLSPSARIVTHLEISGTDKLATGEQAFYVNFPSETLATNGVWITLGSTVTSGDLTGIRVRVTGNAASAGANVRGGYLEAKAGAAKYAAMLEGALIHADYSAGNATISGDVRGLTVQISTGTNLTAANLYGILLNIQTRGSESGLSDDFGMLIRNQAVGGNGRTMGAGLKIVGLNMGGGNAAFTKDIIFQEGASLVDDGTNLTLAGSNLTVPTLTATTVTDGTATLTSGEWTGATLNAMVAKGTWTASGAWTIPAVTLNGIITGGNNNINNIKHLGLANDAATVNSIIYADEASVMTDNVDVNGVYIIRRGEKTSAAYTGHLQAYIADMRLTAGNTQNWISGSRGIVGFYSRIQTYSGSTGTVTAAMGIQVGETSIADAVTILNLYGMYVVAPTVAGAKVTNLYGIYMSNLTQGASLNYGLYIAGAATAAIHVASGNTRLAEVSFNGTLTLNGQIFEAGAGKAQINTTGTWTGLTVQATRDGNQGVIIDGTVISASPANNDTLVAFMGKGKDLGGVTREYGAALVFIEDNTDGAWSGKQEWHNWLAGVENTVMTLSGAGALWIDAGLEIGGALTGLTTLSAFTLNGTLTINGKTFDAGAGNCIVQTTASLTGFLLRGSHADNGPLYRLEHTDTTPVLNSTIGRIAFHGYDHDASPVLQRMGLIEAIYSNITDTEEETTFQFKAMVDGGIDSLAMTLHGPGQLTLKEVAAAHADVAGRGQFWVKNNTPNEPWYTSDDGVDHPLLGKVYPLANTYISGSGTAGADNTAQTVITAVIPANTITQVGDRLRVRIYFRGDTGGNVTMTCTVNGVTVASQTDGGGTTWFMTETWLHYIDSTHANIAETGAGAELASSVANSAGFDWTIAQDVDCDQDQVAGNHIVVYAVFLDVYPKGLI